METRQIVQTAKNYNNYYDDLVGLASRVLPKGMHKDLGFIAIATFILNYEQMWHDIGNQDPVRQIEKFKGKQPLYLDQEHNHRNPDITALDYLVVFKEFMKRWAARKHECSPEENWYKMQDEISELINHSLTLIIT